MQHSIVLVAFSSGNEENREKRSSVCSDGKSAKSGGVVGWNESRLGLEADGEDNGCLHRRGPLVLRGSTNLSSYC